MNDTAAIAVINAAWLCPQFFGRPTTHTNLDRNISRPAFHFPAGYKPR